MREYFHKIITDKDNSAAALPVKSLLFLLSLVYCFFISCFSFFLGLRRVRAGAVVVSIGNITWGGTGKTPLVALVSRILRKKGRKVAVLTRGYGRKKRSSVVIGAGQTGGGVDETGDEACMLAEQLSQTAIVVDPDRIRSAKTACVDLKAEVLVLDDGFQQWRMHKDVDIVVLNAENPFGNGFLIPRGILRQPLGALKAADVIVLNSSLPDPPEELRRKLVKAYPGKIILESRVVPRSFCRLGTGNIEEKPDVLKGKEVGCVCGIGNPDSFLRSLGECGVKVKLPFIFPDHHDFSEDELAGVVRSCEKNGINIVVTTHKDSCRLRNKRAISGIEVWVLNSDIRISGDGERKLEKILSFK